MNTENTFGKKQGDHSNERIFIWKINLEREFEASFCMVLNVRLWGLGLGSSNEVSN